MIKLPPAVQNILAKLTGQLSGPRLQEPQDGDDLYVAQAPMPVLQKLRMAIPKGMSVDLRISEMGKYFSGSIFEKAITTIDKSTLLIIGVVWLAAIISMGLAFAAVRDTAQLKLKADVARALDPVLPRIVRMPLTKDQYEPLTARLKKQFPTLLVEITSKPSLRVQSNNPDEFLSWLNAVSYVDSMVSTIRWTLTTFCVGSECPGEGMMQADLSAESINITQAESVSP